MLRTSGEIRPLPPGVELCAYRVVQEALTDVIKHARPADATVHVEYRPRDLVVRISDNGGGTRAAPVDFPSTSGHGLIGMRERARLCGGAVDAGPRAEGASVCASPCRPHPRPPTAGGG
ncbi:ATP-binding protein [Streptomyces sp. NPDC048845]|uniref:sensor histidine kinase n=1 Tax=Streptomyces sp. NPDC048845 TaxID=3155390 RepID=UPI00343359E0